MNDKFISNKEQEDISATPLPKIGTITNCDFLNIRTEPNMDSAISAIVSKSEPLVINGEIDGWYETEMGFVNANFVNVD